MKTYVEVDIDQKAFVTCQEFVQSVWIFLRSARRRFTFLGHAAGLRDMVRFIVSLPSRRDSNVAKPPKHIGVPVASTAAN